MTGKKDSHHHQQPTHPTPHQQSHNQHHDEHHDEHHDQHHDQHHQPTFDLRLKNTPLDFTKKHPVFQIKLDHKGPQFSILDDRRLQYIRKFAGKIPVAEPIVPLNIPGLIPRIGDLPRTRRLWRNPSFSRQRNGQCSFQTPNLLTRLVYPALMWGLTWGLIFHATSQLYKIRYKDCNEQPGIIYDKLANRRYPQCKLWLRPG